MNVIVRARMIPANPCYGVRVTAGDFETERLVASPVQGLRAAMRLYESGLGLNGFVLCLMDLYTGGRWGELVGQQAHELPVPVPTRRRGRQKRGRTKTPAGTRTVQLPPGIAELYELLLDNHSNVFVFTTLDGQPWRRSNFRQRYWRPAWDGIDAENPSSPKHEAAILPWFTFHEGRHTHSTWMIEDGIPEVARRARLGQKMKGIARTYDHVTPDMRQQILVALERRWQMSLAALTAAERAQLHS
jgi:integrase